MHSKKFTLLMIVLSLGFSAAQVEGSVIVEFSEVSLTSPTLLDGTNYFEPYGLSFEDTTYWGTDSAYIGAGIDNVGIAPMIDVNTIMTVVFNDGAEWVEVDWTIITLHTLTATAYDEYGSFLDEQTETGTEDINHGALCFLMLEPLVK